MEKAKLTKEQAEAIEHWLITYTGGKEELIKTHLTDSEWVDICESLNGMPLSTLIAALYEGYEIEPSPEEKILALYHSTTGHDFSYQSGIRKGILQTLELLNIKIKGVNC